MEQLSAELLERLDKLAASMGTTADQLWDVLLRVGKAYGVLDATVGLLCLFGAVATAQSVRWSWTGRANHALRELVFPVGIMLVPTLTVIGLWRLYTGILYLMVPEAYAIEQIRLFLMRW